LYPLTVKGQISVDGYRMNPNDRENDRKTFTRNKESSYSLTEKK
jgi:hypothetical protein